MENDNNNNNKKNIFLVIVILLVIFIGLFFLINNLTKKPSPDKTDSNTSKKKEEQTNIILNTHDKLTNASIEKHDGIDYYVIDRYYEGEYDVQGIDYEEENDRCSLDYEYFNYHKINTYDEYVEYSKKRNLQQKYHDKNKKYLILTYSEPSRPVITAKIVDVVEKDNKVDIYYDEDIEGVTADCSGYSLVLPLDNNIEEYSIIDSVTKREYSNIVKYGTKHNPNDMTVYKPIIYIYPKEEIEVNIKLGNPEYLTSSYPKYNNGWNVIASPNGNLKDKTTNKNYYALYWEGSNYNGKVEKDGFVIKGEDTLEFLEEKLSILGLNEREINEFIIYWLPRLENNKYNYIRFELNEEIDGYMPIYIEPKPDTLLRVYMNFKPLTKKINVIEQELITNNREGFTVVEWGGSKIN